MSDGTRFVAIAGALAAACGQAPDKRSEQIMLVAAEREKTVERCAREGEARALTAPSAAHTLRGDQASRRPRFVRR